MRVSERVEPGLLKMICDEAAVLPTEELPPAALPPVAEAVPPAPPPAIACDCEEELAVPVPVAELPAKAGPHTAINAAAVTRRSFIG